MTNNTISRLLISFAIGLAIFYVLNSFNLVSASCVKLGTPLQELENSDAVFIGDVRSIEKRESGYNAINFLVIDAYKGVSENTVSVISPDSKVMGSGVDFEKGQRYLIYSYRSYEYEGGKGVLSISKCSRSALLKNAKEDIDAFAILSARSGPVGERLIVSYDTKEGDFFTIDNIEVVNQDLVIDVSYSGGCEKHNFTLSWDEKFMESRPVQTRLILNHDANNDSCKAIKYETLRYDIYPLIEKYIKVYGDDSKLVINVNDKDIEFNVPDYGGDEKPNDDGGIFLYTRSEALQ